MTHGYAPWNRPGLRETLPVQKAMVTVGVSASIVGALGFLLVVFVNNVMVMV